MKGSKPFAVIAVIAVLMLGLSGCGGGMKTNIVALNFSVGSQLSPAVVADPYTYTLAVNGGVGPYTYSVTGGSLPDGVTMTSDGKISGTPTTAQNAAFTVKCTDSQTPTAAYVSEQFTIMVNPVLSVATTTLPTGTVGIAYSGTLAAAGGVSPYTFSVAVAPGNKLPAGLSFGTVDKAGNTPITGTPTEATDAVVIFQVTDAYHDTATANIPITIVGALQGNYAISLSGFNSQSDSYYTVGSLTASGEQLKNGVNQGTITSGVLDENSVDGGYVLSDVAVTGSYAIDPNSQLGTLTLTDGTNTYNYNIAIATGGDVRLMQYTSGNDQAWGSGLMKRQANASGSLTPLVGSYSFGFFGNDSGGNRYGGAGTFINDTTGDLTSGMEDTNDNGTVQSQVLFTGTFGPPDAATGRGTLVEQLPSGAANFVYYYISPTELLALSTDSVSGGNPAILVTMLKQPGTAGGGLFSNATLTGNSVFQLNAVSAGAPDISEGIAAFDGAGNITSYSLDENNNGTLSTISATGTYNVALNGRTTVSGLGTNEPVFYLLNADTGFYIGTDPGVTSGRFDIQTGGPYTNLSLFGTYFGGTIEPVTASVISELDSITVQPPALGAAFTVDYVTSGASGPGNGIQVLNATFAVDATGRVVITASASGQHVAIMYIIGAKGSVGTTSSSTLVWMNTDQNPPRLTIFEP